MKGNFVSEFQSKFKVVSVLGQGGFSSVVFEVLNKIDKWRYAVKRISLRKSHEDVERKMRHVRAMATFVHPNVLRYNHSWMEDPPEGWQEQFDEALSKEEGCSFYACRYGGAYLYIQMELCHSTLAERLSRNKERDMNIMKDWSRQLLKAVAYLHERGIIHRHLVPRNILFVGENMLKVSGFEFMDDQVFWEMEDSNREVDCEVDRFAGNPLYKAPEQSGWNYNSKVDVFTLGLILLEMFIVVTPKSKKVIFEHYRCGESNCALDHDPELKSLVAAMTNLEPDLRPSCKDVLRHSFLNDSFIELSKLLRENLFQNDGDLIYSSKFLNDFIVKRIVGLGGFGCVFEAHNKNDGSTYAVKRIAENASNIERALGEVRKMAALDHEGIVRYNCSWIEQPPKGWQYDTDYNILKTMGYSKRTLLDFDDDSVFIYIEMKLYKQSLDVWLKENQTPASRNLALIKSWFKQIVKAVQYLHDKAIIHSDLKPSNILLDEHDRPKLCDLGIATDRMIENGVEITKTRNVICSPHYRSPEQTSVISRYTSKTDVFALGLILAELCVVMNSAQEKFEIFEYYRQGDPQNSRFTATETADFVAWLAARNPKDRPTCEEILSHSFLVNSKRQMKIVRL